jgi:hypothetical protein
MGWEKIENTTANTPQWITDAKTSIDSFYDDVIVPLVGKNYPPKLEGSIGPVIDTANVILENFSTMLVDPLSGLLRGLTSQLESTVSDIANTGVSALLVTPYNVDGATVKKVPIDPTSIPDNIVSLLGSIGTEGIENYDSMVESFNNSKALFSEQEKFFLNLGNLVSTRMKTLSPTAAVQKAIESLEDTSDPNRPQISEDGAVAGFGILATAKTYTEFLSLIKLLSSFLSIDDLTSFVYTYEKKIDTKLQTLTDWDEVLKEWTDENINGNTLNFTNTDSSVSKGKLTLIELKTLHEEYVKAYPYSEYQSIYMTSGDFDKRAVTFRFYLEDYYINGNKKAAVLAQKPNWYSFTLANTISYVKDFYDAVAFYTEQITAYTKDATSAIKEVIQVIIDRIQQIIDIVTRVIIVIEKFASLPTFVSLYTVSFAGIGGTKLIASELSKADFTGLEKNDFTVFILFTAQSASIQNFTVFYDMFQTFGDQMQGLNLLQTDNLDNVNTNPNLSGDANPGAVGSLDKNDPNSKNNPNKAPAEEVVVAPPALPDDMTELLALYSKSSSLNPPLVFYSGAVTNSQTYPSIAPYWDTPTGVNVTAFLQEYTTGGWVTPVDVYQPFTKGKSVNGNPLNTPTYYKLKLVAEKSNNKLSTEVVYQFIIDPSIRKPPRIFPINVQEGKIYTSLTEGVRWNEFVGYTSTALLIRNMGTDETPNWVNYDYVDIAHPGTGEYIKGGALPNGSYVISITSISLENLLLTSVNKTSFRVNSTAYYPVNIPISGIETHKVYTTNKSITWAADTFYITTTAKLKKDTGPFVDYTSADLPILITDNGTYKLSVKTVNATNSNFFVSKTYTFVVDKVSPSSSIALSCQEIIDDTVFTVPIKLYWSKLNGAKVVSTLTNNTNIVIYNDKYSQLSSVSITGYTGVVYWEIKNTYDSTALTNTRRVRLYSSTIKSTANMVASGTRVNDGVVTLAQVNGSGVSGSVTVAYTSDTADVKNMIATIGTPVTLPMGAELKTNGSYSLDFAITQTISSQTSSRKTTFSLSI